MSVLLYDPAEKRHLLLLREGPWAGRRWHADLRVCDNPCCGCTNVNFECVPDDAPPARHPTSASFALDIERRCIYRSAGRESSALADTLAESVVKELGERGWEYLYDYLLGVKQEQIENCDPRRLDPDLPPDVLRGETTMAGYSEIFPLAPALQFTVGPDRWLAIDDYCVNRDCHCSHVVLQFVTREHERGQPGARQKAPPAVFYDYRSRNFEQAQAPEARQPSLQALLAALKDQNSGFESEVKKRHRRLKAVFRRSPARREATCDEQRPDQALEAVFHTRTIPEGTRIARTGRNDPCPCGSGKKFKKCCGR